MIISNNSLTLDDAGLIPLRVLHAVELGQLDIYRLTEKELARRREMKIAVKWKGCA